MNSKYERICSEIKKLEGKMDELKIKLNALEEKKTELENLEIISAVRAMVMDKGQIMELVASLKKGRGGQVSEHE